MTGEGRTDGSEDDHRNLGFVRDASHPIPTAHVLQHDQHAVGLLFLELGDPGGQQLLIADRLALRSQGESHTLHRPSSLDRYSLWWASRS